MSSFLRLSSYVKSQQSTFTWSFINFSKGAFILKFQKKLPLDKDYSLLSVE